jgi:hypothetical protein
MPPNAQRHRQAALYTSSPRAIALTTRLWAFRFYRYCVRWNIFVTKNIFFLLMLKFLKAHREHRAIGLRGEKESLSDKLVYEVYTGETDFVFEVTATLQKSSSQFVRPLGT